MRDKAAKSNTYAWRVAFGTPLSLVLAAALAVAFAGCEQPADGETRHSPAVAAALHPFGPPPVHLDLTAYLQHLPGAPLGLRDAAGGGLAEQVRGFYAARQQQPAWFDDGRLRPEAKQLVEFLTNLDDQGLEPRDFQLEKLTRAIDAVDKGQAGVRPEEVEVGLTWAALLAGAQLRHGRVSPQEVNAKWLVEREKVDLGAVLDKGLKDGNLVDGLRALDPTHPQFVSLLHLLQRYRDIARHGGWPEVPRGDVIGAGEKGDVQRLRLLAQRLQAEGFLPAVPAALANPAAKGKVRFPAELAAAVKTFQQTRTLDPDGKLGPQTQEELNVPIWGRLRQIELNLERWRWVPDDFGERAVLVNLPGYQLDVEEDHRIVMSMRTVVGKEGWETPVFKDRIRYVELNPYWNIPPGIYAKELAPKLASDPYYLSEHHMEEGPGGADDIRQLPGPDNPLGKIKFLFPNKFDIYLHDTNAKALFQKPDRDGSHGCIRVERPFELADYLYRDDPKWSGGNIERAIETGENKQVPLQKPVPVFILYFTTAVRPDGEVEFYEDIYNLDHEQEAAWEKAGSMPPGRLEPGPGSHPPAEETVESEPGDEPANVSPEGDPATRRGSIHIERADTGEDLQAEPAEEPGPGR